MVYDTVKEQLDEKERDVSELHAEIVRLKEASQTTSAISGEENAKLVVKIKQLEAELEELRAYHDFIKPQVMEQKLEEINDAPPTEEASLMKQLIRENGYLKQRLNQITLGNDESTSRNSSITEGRRPGGRLRTK